MCGNAFFDSFIAFLFCLTAASVKKHICPHSLFGYDDDDSVNMIG